jgi:hypothetical protein
MKRKLVRPIRRPSFPYYQPAGWRIGMRGSAGFTGSIAGKRPVPHENPSRYNKRGQFMFSQKQFTARLCLVLVLAAAFGSARRFAYAEDEAGAAPAGSESAGSQEVKKPSEEERIQALEEKIRILEVRIQELSGQTLKEAPLPKSATAQDVVATAPAAPQPAPVSPPSGSILSFFDKVAFSGFIDTYYDYNFNNPPSQKNGLRNFDINHNQFSLNLLEIAMERQPDPFGFRVDFNFGDTAKLVHSTEPGGADLYQFLQQAYASYKVPMGKGLTVDLGKFVTPLGTEVIETKDNWNYSRSLLFSWAVPYYHFGTRLRYPFSDKFSVAGYVVNGWNNVVDNNGGKTYGIQVALNPTKKLSIVQNYMTGPEQNHNSSDWRHVSDTTVTYAVTSSLSLMANYDYGMDRVLGERVRWQGIAGYARLQVTPWFAIAPRLEWFADPQGFTTGLAQNVKEATFTAEFKLKNSVLLRGEYRQDWSDQAFFEKHDNTAGRNQQTVTLGMIYVIGQEH